VVVIVFLLSFFVDKDFYNDLKDNIYTQYKRIVDKIKGNQSDKIELSDDLMVFFLDVGQADSILIRSQNEYMLIDAGNNEDGDKLVSYFNTLGIKDFKYVVGTHAHEDHIGGMDNIIKSFKIENFYMPDAITSTATFMDVLDALEKKKVSFVTPKEGTVLKLGDSSIEVLYVGSSKEDLNDTSIVLKLTYQDTSFLFMGDATSNVEKEILNKNLSSTVLKVGHHGSKYSSSAAFLAKVRPKYSVISVAKANEYYHPHGVVIDKLRKLNSEILRTDELGTIVALSDGKNVSFKYIYTNTNGG
jgi:competence protein ComEC